MREPPASKARSKVDNILTLWFFVRIEASRTTPTVFNGLRAVDEASENGAWEATKATVATKSALEINIATDEGV